MTGLFGLSHCSAHEPSGRISPGDLAPAARTSPLSPGARATLEAQGATCTPGESGPVLCSWADEQTECALTFDASDNLTHLRCEIDDLEYTCTRPSSLFVCRWSDDPDCAEVYSADGVFESYLCGEALRQRIGGEPVCPDVCAAICGGAPEPFVPDGCPVPMCTCCATDVDCGHVSMEGGQCCAGQCVDCWADWNQNGIGDCVDPEFRGGICVPPVPPPSPSQCELTHNPNDCCDYALWPRTPLIEFEAPDAAACTEQATGAVFSQDDGICRLECEPQQVVVDAAPSALRAQFECATCAPSECVPPGCLDGRAAGDTSGCAHVSSNIQDTCLVSECTCRNFNGAEFLPGASAVSPLSNGFCPVCTYD